MVDVAEAVRRFGPSYLARFGATMPPSHRHALAAIETCRTEARGGHVVACGDCGTVEYVYHSCRNRHCPKCFRQQTERWLAKRLDDVLPVRHFLVTFTVPAELRRIIREHQRELYGVLFRASAEALAELARDPRYVGGRIGLLGVLHTWARTLVYHPHVHWLVPGGGLDDAGRWVDARKGYLVPTAALSTLFRARFLTMVRRRLPELSLPGVLWHKGWVVNIEARDSSPDAVLRYLARYLHRVAITDHRIERVDERGVTFRYKDRATGRTTTMTLEGHEFLRRLLQHVLPKGFHKVRYCGLLSRSYRRRLRLLRAALIIAGRQPPASGEHACDSPQDPPVCRHCGSPLLLVIAILTRPNTQPRAPPLT